MIMTLFTNDPPIEQWFRDLFAELVDSFPGVTKGLSRMPKYWHAFRGIKEEALRKAFVRSAETCKFFPSVPEIQELLSEGFGSQPFTESKDYDHDNKITRERIDYLMKKAGLKGLK